MAHYRNISIFQQEQFIEISEAFQQSQIHSNSHHHHHQHSKNHSASTSNKKSSPKRSPKCNGHVTVSGFHDFQDDPDQDFLHHTGDISFIPLQERGIFIKGMLEYSRDLKFF